MILATAIYGKNGKRLLAPNVALTQAYVDTEYQIEVDGSQRNIFLKTNDVVLDKSFIEPGNIRKLCGKRRFTLAHECAHQILFQLVADDRKIACHKRPEVLEQDLPFHLCNEYNNQTNLSIDY